MKRVLIIIPAYNEEKNIEGVVDNLIANYPQYDYVVVNDEVDIAVDKIESIIKAEKCRVDRIEEIYLNLGISQLDLVSCLQ